MNQKLPYYMAYPMPYTYDEDRLQRRDIEYMKSMYPDIPKRILPYVEEECDRMEYGSSMIYDEYPDRLQLRMMSNRIYENVIKNEKILYGTEFAELGDQEKEIQNRADTEATDLEDQAFGSQRPHGRYRPPRGRNWLKDMVEVMLYQELLRRRCNNRNCRRRIY